MSPATDVLLAAAERSATATASRDRAGWVGLFTADGCVEDPVGSGRHVGHAQIGRFYDTFIAPRQITFQPDVDIVCDTTVVRDVTLEVLMGPGLTLMVPTFIRYDLREGETGWQIASLRAYWELPVMIGQFLRNGLKSLPVLLQLSAALLRNQGIAGTADYVAGVRGARKRAKRVVEQALADGRLGEKISLPNRAKVIAAGNTVAAAVTTPTGRGMVFAELDNRGRDVTGVSVLRNDA